jgi:hypothetical protein
MAKILLGATIGDARNKAGAIVYSKNRFGSYIRQKVSPVQPRTPAALAIRSSFTSLSKGWQALSAINQASWIALASANPVKDVFGNSQTLTGHEFYIRVNQNLYNAGLTLLTAAPANQSVDAPTAGVLTVVHTGTFSMTVVPTPATTDAVVLRATPALSQGRTFVTSLLKQVYIGAPPVSSPLVAGTAWEKVFGTIPTGAKFYGETKYVGANGAVSAPFLTFATST